MLTGGDLVAKTLAQEGVRHFIGVVGGQVLPLFDAIGREPELKLVVPRNEAAGAMMADGYARASGQVAVIISTVGAGAIYSAAGTANAWADHVPIFSISPQVQSWKMYPAQESLQGCYQAEMLEGVTRWNCIAYNWKRIPRLVQRALREALCGEKGPVHMDVPVDVFYQSRLVTGKKLRKLLPPPGSGRFSGHVFPGGEELRTASSLLREASRPIVVAGLSILREAAWEPLASLAAKLASPVALTPAALSGITGDNASYMGILGHPALSRLHDACGQADALLFAGATLREQEYVLQMVDREKVKVIQTSPEPELLGAAGEVEAALAGDAASLCISLASLAGEPPPERVRWRDACRESYLLEMEAIKKDASGNKTGAAVGALGEAMRERDLLVLDGRESCYWGTVLCPARMDNTRFRSWGLKGFGYGLPMALGVKLARPRERVFALCDSEALLHHVQELDTARREGIGVTVCVVGEPYRWREVAEGFGLVGLEANTPAELAVALDKADAAKKAALIDMTGFEAGRA